MAVLAITGTAAGLGPGVAFAVAPMPIDPGRLPPSAPAAPLAPTEQRNLCATTGPTITRPDVPSPQAALDFGSVWPLSRGQGQLVAVIDTGVAAHPRLPGLVPGGDYVSIGDGTGDCDAHGTIVAGLIAASPIPDSGFAGGAPDARILTIRQSSANFAETGRRDTSNDTSNSIGYGNTQTMAMAVRRAADLGATVINISEVACRSAADGLEDSSLGAAVHYAATVRDAVVVAAAGNVGSGGCSTQNPPPDPWLPWEALPTADTWSSVSTIATPAWYDEYVLTVGSVNPDGSPSDFTLGGPWVDVAAPGTGILSLSPDGRGETDRWIDARGEQRAFDGTSFAAPFVSATAALVRARYPELSAQQVISRIEATAHAPAEGWNPYVGHGVVDPAAAVSANLSAIGGHGPAAASSPVRPPAQEPAPDGRPRTVALTTAGGVLVATVLALLTSVALRRGAVSFPRRRAPRRGRG